MKKNVKFKNKGLRLTIILAMLAAISIICGKYLAIRGGDVMRFSLENMPIIFAGMVFGPIAGAVVGVVADFVGCLMVGYTINPLVALGAASIGAISGAMPKLLKRAGLSDIWIKVITVGAAHIIGSIVIKTIGLAAYYSMPLHILMLWRILNYIIVGAIDGVIVHALLNNRGVRMQIKELGGSVNDL